MFMVQDEKTRLVEKGICIPLEAEEESIQSFGGIA
jgi:hypothetical protein